ncbi:diphthine--ammonia ligase [Methanospirillum hungatei]|uniref:diphthine--ammonia ligase n=1 Tax=Methanospirillum hungatei TaxID=2203 RepID=UPI0026EEAA0C|nr:diphthine--ammonia ligase [Methanospirillum hungatei]MCA1915418.1 diphthine--ammonia ligase [Methanospirillum hungatei]
MRIGALLSGGKDSLYAAWRMIQTGHEIACFITIQSRNPESYMFHTPNIGLTRLQAEAAGIPLIVQETDGLEEKELDDLTAAIQRGACAYGLEGIVTGAIQSVYQASRIERICHLESLWCFSPLWLCDQEQYLSSLIADGFEVIIAGVFAEPLDESWLGIPLDLSFLERMKKITKKYHVSLAGEGGEYESFVCNAPFFTKKITIMDAKTWFLHGAGGYVITRAELV